MLAIILIAVFGVSIFLFVMVAKACFAYATWLGVTYVVSPLVAIAGIAAPFVKKQR